MFYAFYCCLNKNRPSDQTLDQRSHYLKEVVELLLLMGIPHKIKAHEKAVNEGREFLLPSGFY